MDSERFKDVYGANLPEALKVEDFYLQVFSFRAIYGDSESGWYFRGSENGRPEQLKCLDQIPAKKGEALEEPIDGPYIGTLRVDSIDDTVAKIEQNGGVMMDSKMPVTDGYWCFCKDPANNMFGLFEDHGGIRSHDWSKDIKH